MSEAPPPGKGIYHRTSTGKISKRETGTLARLREQIAKDEDRLKAVRAEHIFKVNTLATETLDAYRDYVELLEGRLRGLEAFCLEKVGWLPQYEMQMEPEPDAGSSEVGENKPTRVAVLRTQEGREVVLIDPPAEDGEAFKDVPPA